MRMFGQDADFDIFNMFDIFILSKARTLTHKKKIVVDLIAFYLVQEKWKRRNLHISIIFMTLFSPLFSQFFLNFFVWMIRKKIAYSIKIYTRIRIRLHSQSEHLHFFVNVVCTILRQWKAFILLRWRYIMCIRYMMPLLWQ